MQSHIDLFQLPYVVKERIVGDYLGLNDLARLARTCKAHQLEFFSGEPYSRFWRRLLAVDFGLEPDNMADPKKVYQEILLERQRLVAYAHAYIVRHSDVPEEQAFNMILREFDQVKQDPLLSLLTQIKCHQHASFMQSAVALIGDVSKANVQQRKAMLQDVYSFLFTAPAETMAARLNELMPTINEVFVNQANFDLTSEAGMKMLMLSLLSKCDAPHTLGQLLTKLEKTAETKQTKHHLLQHFGSGLCRDAAMMGREQMVCDLLKKFERPDEVGVPAAQPASYNQFFGGSELLPLRAAMSALRDLCVANQFYTLKTRARIRMLENYRETLFVLCYYGAVKELPLDVSKDVYTIQSDARAMLRDVKEWSYKLNTAEMQVVETAFSHVLGKDQFALEFALDNDFDNDDLWEASDEQVSPKKQMRAENDFASDVVFTSPSKRGKVSGSDDDVEFVASPREEDVLSPVRKSFAKLNTGRRFGRK